MSGVSAVDNSASNTQSTSEKSQSTIYSDQFMTILTKQLQYQDPLNPMSDTEFVSQMAQLSTLEQMEQINDKMDKLSELNENLILMNNNIVDSFYSVEEYLETAKESDTKVINELVNLNKAMEAYFDNDDDEE